MQLRCSLPCWHDRRHGSGYTLSFGNWASLAYHELHASQLRALASLRPHPDLTLAADRFEGYMRSPAKRARAFAHKAAFRVRVPR